MLLDAAVEIAAVLSCSRMNASRAAPRLVREVTDVMRTARRLW